MKKCIAFLLSLLILFSFTACADDTGSSQSDTVETYKAKTVEYIESGDTELAIKVLEEGIAVTGSEELQKMLDELNSNTANTVPSESQGDPTNTSDKNNDSLPTQSDDIPLVPFNMNEYIGYWSNAKEYEYDGLDLDIYDTDGDYITFHLYHYSKFGGGSYIGTCFAVLKEEITSNKIVSTYVEDEYGNCGVATIELLDDKVICKLSHYEPWSYDCGYSPDGEYILTDHVVFEAQGF